MSEPEYYWRRGCGSFAVRGLFGPADDYVLHALVRTLRDDGTSPAAWVEVGENVGAFLLQTLTMAKREPLLADEPMRIYGIPVRVSNKVEMIGEMRFVDGSGNVVARLTEWTA